MKQFKDMCPKCKSENFIMTGDPEFNDWFYCKDCNCEFSSFLSEEIDVNVALGEGGMK